jgi:hypothetical protein
VGAAAPEATWWHPAWKYRRQVTMRAERAGYAAVRFTTFGWGHPDGADIVVLADEKTRVPHALLDWGREDSALIAFPVPDPKRTYRIYFGNPSVKAPSRRQVRLPKSGLLCEVRKLGEGTAESWEEMDDLIEASPDVLGRAVMDRCALGVNPFGPSEDYLVVWHGWLKVTETGTWRFATNSNGPSFVLVDNRVVASWPGWHGAEGGATGEHSGEKALRRGIRRFMYVFAARGARNGHVCGIQGPEDAKLLPLTTRDCVPFLSASVGALEEYSVDGHLDFEWRLVRDLGLAGRDVCLVRFTDRSSFPDRKIESWQWRFGDGQTGTGRVVEHCYLERGTYQVEMTLTFAGQTALRIAAKVAVHPRGVRGRDSGPFAAASLGYDLERLSLGALKNLAFLRWNDKQEALDPFYRAARVLFRAKPEFAGKGLETYAEALLDHEFFRAPPQALALATYVAGGAKRPELRAHAAVMAAELQWHVLGKKKEAERALRDSLSWLPSDERKRLVMLLLSDLCRSQGRDQEAQRLFESAQSLGLRSRDLELVRGERIFRIRHYLKEQEFGRAWEALNDWLASEPAALEEGEICFFRSEILAAAGMAKPALQELERLLTEQLEPRRALRRRDCLQRAAELYRTLGMTEKAAAAAKTLEREFGPARE